MNDSPVKIVGTAFCIAALHAVGLMLLWPSYNAYQALQSKIAQDSPYSAETAQQRISVTLQTHLLKAEAADVSPSSKKRHQPVSSIPFQSLLSSSVSKPVVSPSPSTLDHQPSPLSIPSNISSSHSTSFSKSNTAAICRPPIPHYPKRARQRGEHGITLIHLAINPNGQIQQATVQQSSGFASLDRAALAAAKKAVCQPDRHSLTTRQVKLRFQFELLD